MRRAVFLFVALIALVLLALNFKRYVKVSRVSCKSQYGICSEEIEKLASGAIGKSLGEAQEYLAKGLRESEKVSQFSISFVPFRLSVSVVEKKAEVALTNQEEDVFKEVDLEANVLGVKNATLLPIMVIEPGDIMNEELSHSVLLFRELSRHFGASKSHLSEEGIRVKIESYDVIFPLDGDIDELLGALSLILSQLNTELIDTRIYTIDLRFNNPVLR